MIFVIWMLLGCRLVKPGTIGTGNREFKKHLFNSPPQSWNRAPSTFCYIQRISRDAMVFQSRQNCQNAPKTNFVCSISILHAQNNFWLLKWQIFVCLKQFLPAQSDYNIACSKTVNIAFSIVTVCACSTTGENYQTEILRAQHPDKIPGLF